MRVLQVAGAVHEHHDRVFFTWFQLGRAVEFGPDRVAAVARGHGHDLGLDPFARLVFGGARVGQLHGRAAVRRHGRQLGRHVARRVVHQQLAAVRRQREALDAFQVRDFARAAVLRVHGADFIRARGLAVAEHVGSAAVDAPLHVAGFPFAAGERARAAVDRLGVQVGVAAFLGLEPQRVVVRQPAEVAVVEVDPGFVGEAVLRFEFGGGQVDGGDPAVLVVDRAQHDGGLLAVQAPAHGVGAVGDAQRAVALQRIELGRRAQLRQRVDRDAGQGVEGDVLHLVRGQVDQFQGVRRRAAAADAGALVVHLFVARFGHVARHLADPALVCALGGGDDHQPAPVLATGRCLRS
jgi:hypothetical protein